MTYAAYCYRSFGNVSLRREHITVVRSSFAKEDNRKTSNEVTKARAKLAMFMVSGTKNFNRRRISLSIVLVLREEIISLFGRCLAKFYSTRR